MDDRLLGPVEVRDDGRPVVLRSPEGSALLALLLLHRGEVASRERLIGGLWGEHAPPTVAKGPQGRGAFPSGRDRAARSTAADRRVDR